MSLPQEAPHGPVNPLLCQAGDKDALEKSPNDLLKARYRNHIVHIFADDIPIIFVARRKEGEYEVFTEREIDLGEYFGAHRVVERVHWPKALFTNPNIVLDQDLAENLYMAGDHNGVGMEPAAISGIYAANRIIGAA